jgi:hypothetical protein
VSVIVCDVNSELFAPDHSVYEVVVPNPTCDVDAWSVVQVIVAEVVVMFVAVTEEITGAPVAVVVKMKLADTVCNPTASVDMAA